VIVRVLPLILSIGVVLDPSPWNGIIFRLEGTRNVLGKIILSPPSEGIEDGRL